MTNQPGKPQRVEAGDLGDALGSAQRRDLAEHPVAVRLRRRRSGSSRAAAPGGARAGTSVGRRRPGVCVFGTAAQSPSAQTSSWPSTRSVSSTTTRPRSSSGRSELGRSGFARTPAVQTSVSRRDAHPVRERRPAAVVRLERVVPTWISMPRRSQPPGGVLAEPARDLGEDLRAASTSTQRCGQLTQRRVRAERGVRTRSFSSASASTPA